MKRDKLWLFAMLFSVFCAENWSTSSADAQNYNWTGFYVGAQAGFSKPKDLVTYRGSSVGLPFNAADERIVNRENGFAGGVQAGYNYQLGWFVPGAELDFGYMGFNGDRQSPINNNPTVFAVSSGGLFGTVTGRIGAAIDRALLYVKGGLAYANLKVGVEDNTAPLTTDASKRSTRTGWTIGGGIEYGLAQNWTIKTEYQFMDLGKKDISAVASDGITDTWRHDVSAHLIKVGLNYKF